jgi:hypothetical protein
MARFRQELEDEFFAAFPDDFLQQTLRVLASSYRGAHAECRLQYPPAEAHDLYPIMRRAMIESQLAEVAKEYPEISAEPTPNPTGTSYYRLLSSGNVRLTVNAVDHPNTKVRRAMFRNTYAQASQPNLFGEPLEEGTMLYGILLHGPELINKTRPEFAHIVIPNRDCSEYLGRIDLFGRYSGLARELWTYEEEEIPDELDMGIRPESERRKDDEEEAEDHTG